VCSVYHQTVSVQCLSPKGQCAVFITKRPVCSVYLQGKHSGYLGQLRWRPQRLIRMINRTN